MPLKLEVLCGRTFVAEPHAALAYPVAHSTCCELTTIVLLVMVWLLASGRWTCGVPYI